MGYTTEFYGKFHLNKPLKPEHYAYLKKFSETRRMKRDSNKLLFVSDPIWFNAFNPTFATNRKDLLGIEAGYFVGGTGSYDQDRDESIIDYNEPPAGQPGLWCNWIPNKDGNAIIWNGGEKFYYYTEWLQYLIDHFLEPWGYELFGKMRWQGEEDSDFGTIDVQYNKIVIYPTKWFH